MPKALRVVDIILEKRNGLALSTEEIAFMIDGYTRGQIPDYQIAAWLMTICWRGMDDRETTDLTLAMAHSGDTLDLHDVAPITVDKHSTGGVGDKTSLVLTPLLASCGLVVAKMSGRGLGFSGGTIDKLESIPGFRAELTLDEFREAAGRVGLVISAQSLDLAPADKKLYALRDVTGTVESLPLIASSIMSKKLAAGSDCIVLDVKVGHGAFMPDLGAARALAQIMVRIGQRAGRKVRAVISDMDQPLGYAVGNALELREAIDTLHGHGPADLIELCLQLGEQMLQMATKASNDAEARALLQEKLASGAAWTKFRDFVQNQGGTATVLDHPNLLPQARYVEPFPCPQEGYIRSIDARQIAQATIVLGAGRTTKGAAIDHAVGIVLHAKVSDAIAQGQPLLTIHANDATHLETARQIVASAYELSADPVPSPPLILEIV
jgi:pyrimidine-nucleoside phosphorylase